MNIALTGPNLARAVVAGAIVAGGAFCAALAATTGDPNWVQAGASAGVVFFATAGAVLGVGPAITGKPPE